MSSKNLLLLSLLAGCIGKDDSGPFGQDLLWYTTCGDPTCGGYSGPSPGVPLCDGQEAGTACVEDGAECDPVDDCNALLVCTSEDPKDQEGGCPVSLRAFKKDIHYLDGSERDALATQLLGTKLARYRYKDAVEGSPERLGFLIDDQPGSPAVRPDGGHVDLYGYTSMAVATIQRQQAEIETLKAQIAAMQVRLDALEARPR